MTMWMPAPQDAFKPTAWSAKVVDVEVSVASRQDVFDWNVYLKHPRNNESNGFSLSNFNARGSAPTLEEAMQHATETAKLFNAFTFTMTTRGTGSSGQP